MVNKKERMKAQHIHKCIYKNIGILEKQNVFPGLRAKGES
jgi:hypothetical protein